MDKSPFFLSAALYDLLYQSGLERRKQGCPIEQALLINH